MKRHQTRRLQIGAVPVGGDAPVTVQSMTNTDTRDPEATAAQIQRLAEAGCEIVRVAVPDEEAASQLAEICKESPLPVVADIHFNHRLALQAVENGVDALRINPGNIGGKSRVQELAAAAAAAGIPIRVGVNSGSLERELLQKYGRPTPEALVESARRHVELLEDEGFASILVSLKSSDVRETIASYRLFAATSSHPLHLGVTEAGTLISGTVKSAIGIGTLLLEGLGDTIRVSLTAPPEEEVRVGFSILRSLGIRRGVEVISCPTCGRTQIDVAHLAAEVERRTAGLNRPLKIAVMGCAVNGPGEAREADLGLAGGRGKGVIFRGGEVVATVPEERLVDRLLQEVDRLEETPS